MLNNIFSGRQMRQDMRVFLTFGNCPQHTLMMGAELVPKTYENPHILTWLLARENLTDFCCHESFKTCMM